MLTYQDDLLHMDGHRLSTLARSLGTPLYVYSQTHILARAAAFRAAFPRALVAFALKANRFGPLLHALAQAGLGADVVSLGEWQAALAAGFPPERIVVNGNAKSDALLQAAIAAGAHSLNLDAVEEIPRVAAAARHMGRRARVVLRVNPGLDVQTHPHLQVAAPGSHFGIPREQLAAALQTLAQTPELHFLGLHFHPGSQLTAAADWHALGRAVRATVQQVQAAGWRVSLVNWGGGLGITYTQDPDPTPQELAAVLAPYLAGLEVTEQVFEPGRWLVARGGVLVVQVVQVKQAWGRRFVAVDGGMNALLRPALYGAHHRIWPVRRRQPLQPATVVGPNCESADVLVRAVPLPVDLAPGDWLAILDAGAYGASMANRYNARPLPTEVLLPQAASAV